MPLKPRARRYWRTVLLMPVCSLVWVSCSPLLSKRTDEQAWIEYLQDLRSKRMPATRSYSDRFNEIDVRKILLSCNKSPQLESCYRSKALVAFDAVFKNDSNYKKLQQEFFSTYSFERVFTMVQAFHQVLLSGMDLRALDHVRDLHQKCDDRENQGVQIQSFGPFLGGDTDIPKAYYRCLNDEMEKDEEQLLSETSERLGLTIRTQEARQWIRERQIHPIYEKYTHDWFSKQMQLETERWQKEKAEIAGRIERGESLQSAVKRLSGELRGEYKFIPIEVYLTELYKGAKHP